MSDEKSSGEQSWLWKAGIPLCLLSTLIFVLVLLFLPRQSEGDYHRSGSLRELGLDAGYDIRATLEELWEPTVGCCGLWIGAWGLFFAFALRRARILIVILLLAVITVGLWGITREPEQVITVRWDVAIPVPDPEEVLPGDFGWSSLLPLLDLDEANRRGMEAGTLRRGAAGVHFRARWTRPDYPALRDELEIELHETFDWYITGLGFLVSARTSGNPEVARSSTRALENLLASLAGHPPRREFHDLMRTQIRRAGVRIRDGFQPR